jgi:hypothetical protein
VSYLVGEQARPRRTDATILGEEAMSASDAAEDAPRTDRSERNILLTLALVAAAEVCAFAWLFH